MNGQTTHVVFLSDGQRYAVPSGAVSEIIGLPELTMVPQVPHYVAGVFDLHGTITPALNLGMLKKRSTRYLLSESVIVINASERALGIIVDEVLDVSAALEAGTILRRGAGETSPGIIDRAVRVENQIALLLSLDQLIRYAEPARNSTGSLALPVEGARPEPDDRRAFFWNVPEKEQKVFRQRALTLSEGYAVQERVGLAPLAVFGLNGERFAMALEWVREFAEARAITPLPCCPQHIVGHMNLRGEILTVVDVRPALKMPFSTTAPVKIIVVEHGGFTVAIGVDEVYEACYLDPACITGLPHAKDAPGEYLTGSVPYDNHFLTIVDLPKLLEGGALVVNDET